MTHILLDLWKHFNYFPRLMITKSCFRCTISAFTLIPSWKKNHNFYKDIRGAEHIYKTTYFWL